MRDFMCFYRSCLYDGSIYNSVKKYFVVTVHGQKSETLVLIQVGFCLKWGKMLQIF